MKLRSGLASRRRRDVQEASSRVVSMSTPQKRTKLKVKCCPLIDDEAMVEEDSNNLNVEDKRAG